MVTDSDLTRHRESPCLFRTVTGNPPFPFSFFPFPFPLPFPLLYPSRQLSFSTPLLLPFAFQFEFSLFWHIRSLQELTTWLWTAAFVSVCPSDACLNASLLAIPLSPSPPPFLFLCWHSAHLALVSFPVPGCSPFLVNHICQTQAWPIFWSSPCPPSSLTHTPLLYLHSKSNPIKF